MSTQLILNKSAANVGITTGKNVDKQVNQLLSQPIISHRHRASNSEYSPAVQATAVKTYTRTHVHESRPSSGVEVVSYSCFEH